MSKTEMEIKIQDSYDIEKYAVFQKVKRIGTKKREYQVNKSHEQVCRGSCKVKQRIREQETDPSSWSDQKEE